MVIGIRTARRVLLIWGVLVPRREWEKNKGMGMIMRVGMGIGMRKGM